MLHTSLEQGEQSIKCSAFVTLSALKAEAFLDPALLQNYKDGDFHTVYVAEIEKILVSDNV